MPDAFAADPVALAAPFDEAASLAAARAVAERQVEMLGRLAEVGLALGVGLEREALAPPAGGAAPGEAPREAEGGLLGARGDAGLTYSRIARAVRMTLALQSKLLQDITHLGRVEAEARRGLRRKQLEARRKTINSIVLGAIHDAAEAEAPDDDAAEGEGDSQALVDRLAGGLYECLHDEDEYGDILQRPIGEVVALICKDLGLEPDWDAWAHKPWAVEEAAADAPGSPFARRAEGGVSVRTPLPDLLPPRWKGGDGGDRAADAWKPCEGAAPPAPTLRGSRPHPHPCPSPLEREGLRAP
jgi:hypothetical protein